MSRSLTQPFRFGGQAGVALTDDADRHLRDKIEAVLFTAPGERVNRPSFGVGLNQVVFEGIDPLTLAALEFRISEGLRRDLGSEILLDQVDIDEDGPNGTIVLRIQYRRRSDRSARTLEVGL